MNRLIQKYTALLLVLSIFAQPTHAAKVKVVASFSVLGDIVQNVGGDAIELTTLVGPDADAHEFHANPGHARAVSKASIIFVNGRGFDTWAVRLLKSSGSTARLVSVSDQIKARPRDPHTWQNVANAIIYVENIRRALEAVAPHDKAIFQANAASYKAELTMLNHEIRLLIEATPRAKRKVITTHDAFGFFAEAYGVEFIAPLGLSTHSQASAKTVARLINQIKREKISALFFENIADNRLMTQIGKETRAVIGGRLYSDALSGTEGPAPDYISMMRLNARHLTGAMSKGS